MDQLELDLFKGVPWGGRSPRALTRVALSIIFKPEGVREDSIFFDMRQIDLFKKSGPRRFAGASPLLPLPWERDNG